MTTLSQDPTTTTPVVIEDETGLTPRQVIYCSVCTFPPEYCEFGPHITKCKDALQQSHPNLFTSIWSEEAISSNLAALTLKQAQDLQKEAAKKEKKTLAKADREREKMASSKIVLTKAARTKRKVTTSVSGLHMFSPPLPTLKVIAKGLSSRFATGASVSKSIQNPAIDEIVIQGDVADELRLLILSRSKPFQELPTEDNGGVSGKNIVIEEEKKLVAKKTAVVGGGGGDEEE